MTDTLIQILRDCVNTLQAAIKQTLCQGQHLVKQCFKSCSTLKQLDFVKTKLNWSQLQTPDNAKPEKNNSAPNCSPAGIHYQVSLNHLYIGSKVWNSSLDWSCAIDTCGLCVNHSEMASHYLEELIFPSLNLKHFITYSLH